MRELLHVGVVVLMVVAMLVLVCCCWMYADCADDQMYRCVLIYYLTEC